VDASLAQEPVVKKLNWAEVFFSFSGRITRTQFLIGLIVMFVVAYGFAGAILFAINAIFAAGADESKTAMQQLIVLFENRLFIILSITSWWPAWALTLKRLHDIGQGWTLLLVFIAIDFGAMALEIFERNDAATKLTLFNFGLYLMLAALKGTSGPNEYGPDPLLGLDRKSGWRLFRRSRPDAK